MVARVAVPGGGPVAFAIGVDRAHLQDVLHVRLQAGDCRTGPGHAGHIYPIKTAEVVAPAHVVTRDRWPACVVRRGPAHLEAGGRDCHCRRLARAQGRLANVREIDRHRNRVRAAPAVVGLDPNREGRLRLEVERRLQGDLTSGGVEAEQGCVRSLHRVGQAVAVRVRRRRNGRADVAARRRVLRDGEGARVDGERRGTVGVNHRQGGRGRAADLVALPLAQRQRQGLISLQNGVAQRRQPQPRWK